MPSPQRPPTARMRRLASELTSLRTTAALSRDDVQAATGINAATLYRIEFAKARPQARTLRALLELYEVPADRRDALTALLKDASQQSWLQTSRPGLRDEYNTLISFELEAREMWNFEQVLIPGLLQTEPYARKIIRGTHPHLTEEQVAQRVETRMERQRSLTQLKLHAILDEAALRRRVGTSEEMRSQLEHLQTLLDRPEVTIQVLPFDAGPHPALLGAFAVLKFDEPVASDIVYLEGLSNDLFLDDAENIERYTDAFNRLRELATDRAGTDRLLTKLSKAL